MLKYGLQSLNTNFNHIEYLYHYTQKNNIMISRIWHGYTTKDNADTYERLLQKEIFVGIANKNIDGYREIQFLRRELPAETEFITIMWFDSVD